MARTSPSSASREKILRELRLAARKGDRVALELALDQMRTLALSPRYWEKYLALLRNPLARLVDLIVIKQSDRIARQKGWKLSKSAPDHRPTSLKAKKGARRGRDRRADTSTRQPSLFDV